MRELMLFDAIVSSDLARWGMGVSSAMLHDALNESRNEEVLLLVNSPGGDAHEGMAMADSIQRHGNVTVRGTGVVASAATLLFPKAHKAESTENTRWMIHEAALSFGGSLIEGELKMYLESIGKLNNQISKLYADRGKKTAEEYMSVMRPGVYMDASEWLEDGQIDEVVSADAKETNSQPAYFDAKIHTWMQDAPDDLKSVAMWDRPWAGSSQDTFGVLCGRYGCPSDKAFSANFAAKDKPPLKRFIKNQKPEPPEVDDVALMQLQALEAFGEFIDV